MNWLDPGLAELAAQWGVLTCYTDIRGVERVPPPESLVAVLRALGAPLECLADCEDALASRAARVRGIEPIHVAWNGEISFLDAGPLMGNCRRAEVRIRFEDGTERHFEGMPEPEPGPSPRRARVAVQGPFPLGIHDVEIETGGRVGTTRVLAAPRLAYLPPQPRNWGVFLPLHGLGPAGTSLPATYTDFRAILRWIGRAGGSYVATLPLLPTFLDEPFEPSPYAPVSRLFLNELYVDPMAAQESAGVSWPAPASSFPAGRDEVEYRVAWRHLRALLGPLANEFFVSGKYRDSRFQKFLLGRPAVQDYARFRATATATGRPWRQWAPGARGGRLLRDDFEVGDYRFFLFAAWCAEDQMTAALSDAGAARAYLDLPLGVHPAGYDVWRHRDLFAEGVTAGAPPDAFFDRGQNWGFPPLIPEAGRSAGYRYLIECLRQQLRFSGALRLDHVMALERLYWVPEGFDATEGVYVRYPRDELFALLALESHRYQSMIVGEDLGTVTPSIRSAMEEHAIQRMFVVQFEVDPDREPSLAVPGADAVTSVNTHDLPTFTAWLRALDARDRLELGLMDADTASATRAERERTVQALCRGLRVPGDPPDPDVVLEAVMTELARGPARLVMLNIEDAWLETRQLNVPGTTTERPNWQYRAPFDTASLPLDARLAALLERIDGGRTLPQPAVTGTP